jgi:hypothetical protein
MGKFLWILSFVYVHASDFLFLFFTATDEQGDDGLGRTFDDRSYQIGQVCVEGEDGKGRRVECAQYRIWIGNRMSSPLPLLQNIANEPRIVPRVYMTDRYSAPE